MQFPFQLLVSEAIFLLHLPKRKYFLPKLLTGILAQILMSALWESLLVPYEPQALSRYVLLYIGYALLTAIPILSGFEIGVRELIFILAGGYATEHVIFAFTKIILYLMGMESVLYGSLTHLLLTRYGVYIMGALAVYLLIVRTRKRENPFRDSDFRIAVLGFTM